MNTRISLIAFCLALAAPLFADDSIAPARRVELFDGKTLTGWVFVSKDTNQPGAVWSVTNGVLACAGKPNGYARTTGDYRDYQLHVEWRWPDGPGNSGVFLHVTGEDKVWPMCLEMQLAAGRAGDIRLNGGSTLAGKPADFKSAPRRADSSEKAAGEWNAYDIICRSNTVTVRVNDVLQNEMEGASVASGFIALQAEGKAIEFRNVWVGPAGKP